MKTRKTRIFSAILTLCMLFTLLPPSAFAAETVASGTCGTNLTWTLDSDGLLTVSGTGAMTNYSSGSSIPWYSQRNTIKSVTISAGVTSIGDFAFSYCSSLTSISIPDSVTSIGSNAFYRCSSLTSISIPDSVTSIGYYAFSGCSSLTSISIPDSVTSIGSNMFKECSSLTSISIPDSVTSIGYYAFSGCSSLTSINIPDSVTSIGGFAFSYCSSLTSISIPDSVTSIGSYAFYRCSSLTSISISNCVTSIGYEAFSYCSSLTDVYYSGTEAQWAEISIDNDGNERLTGATIHYNYVKPPERASHSTANSYTLSRMEFGNLCINAHGTANAFFRVLNECGDYVPSLTVSYTIGSKTASAVTDANGIFGVQLPWITDTMAYTVTFSAADGKEITNSTQTVTAAVKPFSYKQSWEISAGAALEGKIGPGAELAAGVKAEAAAIKASVKGSKKLKSALEDSYENGVRTLEVSVTNTDGLSMGVKSGIDAQLPASVKLDLISAKASAAASVSREYGYKIVGYDETNLDDVSALGSFYLLSLLSGSSSVMNLGLSDLLSGSICNTGKITGAITADADAGVLGLKYEKENSDTTKETGSVALAGAGATFVHKTAYSFDEVDNTKKISASQETETGYGVGKGISTGTESTSSKTELSLGDYVYGKSKTNYNEISATYDADTNKETAVSYKTYMDNKKDVLWVSETENTYATVTYTDEALENILKARANIADFDQNTDILFHINDAIEMLSASGEQAAVTQTQTHERGFDFTVPVGLTIGIGAELDFSIAGADSFSYNDQTGAIFGDITYKTTESDITSAEISAKTKSIGDILTPAFSCVGKSLGEKLSTIWKGLKNSFVLIITLPKKLNASYAVYCLRSSLMGEESASVSATVGDPCVVQCYADEAGTTPITDEQLNENPIPLELSYTTDMLSLAGASGDAAVVMLYYDAQREIYIVEASSVQDKANHTVTAQITHNGEYILAVDSAAPCISDFSADNESAKPELSALVSDLSGIAAFRFWIDDGEDLVTKANLAAFYNEKTDLFTYPVTTALSVGEHTAHFMATDSLGNAMAHSVDFTFTVSEIQGTIEQITCSESMITSYDPVTVTATVSAENTFDSMILQYSVDGTVFSTQMEQNGLRWTAAVTPIAGASSISFLAIAADGRGNTVRSEKLTVSENLPSLYSAKVEKVSSEANGSGNDYKIKVTNSGETMMANVLVASFDTNGKMLELRSEIVALKTGESETVTVTMTKPAAKTDVFVLEKTSNLPMSAALRLDA